MSPVRPSSVGGFGATERSRSSKWFWFAPSHCRRAVTYNTWSWEVRISERRACRVLGSTGRRSTRCCGVGTTINSRSPWSRRHRDDEYGYGSDRTYARNGLKSILQSAPIHSTAISVETEVTTDFLVFTSAWERVSELVSKGCLELKAEPRSPRKSGPFWQPLIPIWDRLSALPSGDLVLQDGHGSA